MKGTNRGLFGTFFKIGLFTFGGGWAMLSIIEKEIVDRHKWLPREEFLDLVAMAQSLPGILAVNMAIAIGDRIKGRAGSLSAAIGTILPSFAIILAIAIFLTPEAIKNNPALSAIFKGIRPAVVALILAPVVTTARSAKLRGWLWLVPPAVALLVWSGWPVVSNPILYIVLGGCVGLFVAHSQVKKGGKA